MIRFIDIIYYYYRPKALFDEAVAFLTLTEAEILNIFIAQGDGERYEFLTLLGIVCERLRERGSEEHKRHLPLFRHMTILACLKGWV